MNNRIIKKIYFCCLLSVLAACTSQTRRFAPYVIDDLEPRPEFWKVRTAEIMSICESVEVGRSEKIATTPLGYPVYAVFYGDFSEEAPQSNWSAGNSSNKSSSYLGDVSSRPQTIMFAAGIHGSEPESVAAAVNMISLLETGKDLKGETDEDFLQLASQYRLIILPCVNMDGRSISPDHFRGQPYEVFRACSQGVWKDGSLVGWRGSKEHFPLPLDELAYPGGYPNGDGYNIQHDVTPGDMRTQEAKAICRLMARWRVDCFLNGHSCEYEPFIVQPSYVDDKRNYERASELFELLNAEFRQAGLTSKVKKNTGRNTLNLTNLVTWCSGGVGLTLECYHGCYTKSGKIHECTFSQLMAPAFISLKTIMKEGLVEPLAPRNL